MIDDSYTEIGKIISAFRRRTGNSSGVPITNTPVCPRTNEANNFIQKYTFNNADLASCINDTIVCHHGYLSESLTPRAHLLYRATPIVFAHRALGHINLSTSQVKEILEGHLTSWNTIGYRGGSIRLYRHAGNIQSRVFNSVAAHIFRAEQIREGFVGCDDYENLAERSHEDEACLVFGLRPEFARHELQPVSINDENPATLRLSSKYPSQQVWISAPNDCSLPELVRYLDTIAERAEADVKSLKRLGAGAKAVEAA